ncbi:peptidoglycan -binding protein, partial [Salmonella enterica subsp. enterica]|nr:peptidoglycan -binding protein [Salmonella enterica subsp. enterica serovar Enteritidis]
LDASEQRDKESNTKIADLGKRLNVALAQRVQELNRYRSDFFGRLREILSDRENVRIVGDRFVFQSEVLFPAGSEQINAAGQTEMKKLADAIIELQKEIPPEINWVLRVDGHTDNRQLSGSGRYADNWELSSARATSVVKYLIANGVPANRLVAAGFGEYQPLDTANTDEARSKNRRIELKLTER